MTTPNPTHNPVLPLPSHVRARLRSTVTITSLATAVSELLQNSLDASSTSITVSANLTRNSCTITDNGHGIPSSQLASVATLYNTSKYPPSPKCFGSRGEALASLAEHCLLSVTSRAEGYRSSHMVRWSYGKKVFQGPAPEHLTLQEHGTTVRVDGLWANLPVRLKARENMDKEKEWDEIVRRVVELLMSGTAENVAVIVRDENAVRKLAVKAGGNGPWDLRVLKMAGIAGPEGWEPVKAKQRSVSIEGWISTKGSVGRGCQFLYVNGFPLSSGNTMLHTEANRVFTNSAFGVVEEADEGREGMVKRGALKKSAERKGMFVLRIECRSHGPRILGGEGGTEGKAGVEGENLKAAVELLRKLIYEFLKAHHFRPFSISDGVPKPGTIPDLFATHQPSRPASPSKSLVLGPVPQSTTLEERALDISDFSRARTAKKDNVELSGRTSTGTASKISASRTSSLVLRPGNIRSFASRSTKSSSPGLPPSDEVFNWLDPNTGKLHHIDSRTGNVKVPRPASGSDLKRTASSPSLSSTDKVSLQPPNKRTKTSHSSIPMTTSHSDSGSNTSSTEATPVPGKFVQNLLSKYRNPVFPVPPATCEPIPSLSAANCCIGGDESVTPETHAFTTATSLRLNRITKTSLQRAKVIAQIDNKYILLLLPGCPSTTSTFNDGNDNTSSSSNDMLVILDQHAASERIRVESLFESLCSPSHANTCTPLLTPIPLRNLPQSEFTLITRHKSAIEHYGVRLSITSEATILITALPAVAAERLAVVSTAGKSSIAEDLVRRWAVELEEGLIQPPPPPSPSGFMNEEGEEMQGKWWTHLASLPSPLKDMVNSRACRGAVMFGDPMEMGECRELVRRLGMTKWPFMCAHGRPCVRPLVELGGGVGRGGAVGVEDGVGRGRGGGGGGGGGGEGNKTLMGMAVNMASVERRGVGFKKMWTERFGACYKPPLPPSSP